MPLSSKLKGKLPDQVRKSIGPPVWKGPQADGVTFSLLNRYLACKERFRIRTIEGLRPADKFNHRTGYGNMWHACEESLAAGGSWPDGLREYVKGEITKYPHEQDKIAHWYEVCKVQFPLYVDYWATHPDVADRTPLFQEKVFDVPYRLPSGRAVRLRGKYDAVDVLKAGSRFAALYLQENKTKSRIDERSLRRQLTFDLQTMLYLVSLRHTPGLPARVGGVRYNVVRRTEHRQGKAETPAAFYRRLDGIMRAAPHEWFMRWKVEVHEQDVRQFEVSCLVPLLEELCDWYDLVTHPKLKPAPTHARHYRMPYGVFNPIHEGFEDDLDEYLATGSTVGLQQVDDLFPELKGGDDCLDQSSKPRTGGLPRPVRRASLSQPVSGH